ncbi:Uncharacterised protein [Yersinia frederiksenii]|nr:Uncharacterised protein [Yersinia frederiksenii]
MSNINKVLFAYPVNHREGMSKEEMCIPSPLMHGIVIGEVKTVVINIGMMIEVDERIILRAFVNPVGKFNKDDPINNDGKFENLQTHYISSKQVILLSAIHVEDVNFECSGMYEIKVLLLKISAESPETEEVVDEIISHFYVLARSNT